MKLILSVASLAGVAAAAFGGIPTASAHGGDASTCADVDFLDVHVHGDHVVRDYVKGPDGEVGHGEAANTPGGPGPGFHFTIDGLAPGASFCNPQAHPNGFNTPDNVPVPGKPAGL